jgi:hypothetical protein
MTIFFFFKRTTLFQDEALGYMKQIQQFQEQQPSWQQLPQDERQTNENQVIAIPYTFLSALFEDGSVVNIEILHI